ncbi:MAG: dihydroorotate dehydrogenase, partial [Treponema sp.]|nr:dihydroorotate dehydrogenase [Treponema sp.]
MDKSPDLSVSVAGLSLRNPVIAASGAFASGREYARIIDAGRLGGICSKGLTIKPRLGNTGARIWETPSGLLNSIGLENPGVAAFIKDDLPFMRDLGPAAIANLCGSTVEDYEAGAFLLAESDVDMVELNISCPNVKAGGMAFGLDPKCAGEVVARARGALGSKPLMAKLSPNAADIAAVARACLDAGADALSLVNTFKAMAFDLRSRRPVFENGTAGLSGPAIKPIALRMVWELRRDLGPDVPIVGMGGIACASDALEFLMAGATALQVGTATFANPRAMLEIIDGIEAFMQAEGI